MKRYSILAGIAILLMTACSPSIQVDYDPGSYGIYTESAMTVQAQMTQSVQTVNPPTQTPIPVGETTQTPIPSATTTLVWTPSQTTYCDQVAFIKDVTIPDATVWIQGTSLTKTWRLKNNGTCTWTSGYSLVFKQGAQMGAPSTANLPGNVRPGETVDISVNLIVPNTPGHYVGYWMLKSTSGVLFGYGDRADKPFYIDLYSGDRNLSSITGKVCYPSERIPPMTIYIQNMNNNQIVEVSIAQDQASYQATLEPGTYIAYAWTNDFQLGGAYTFAEHTLKAFEVKRGSTAEHIDICDWYGGPGSVPYPPNGPVATPTPYMDIPALTLGGLKNAEYRVAVNGVIQTIRVTNGLFQLGTDPTTPGFLTVTVNEPVAFGDLNGDSVDDAAIMVSEGYGGTGVNVYVAAVANSAGIPLHKASVWIDDRAIIQSIRIDSGYIIVNAIVHGDNDPGCCPSKQVTRIFRLVDQSLVEQ
ncbi:MAG TPA: NBR1-Ig-like domain-containing protein [Anaerolineales bacterium]|nr:NBR1-Ig-like domain-containing protein [Anaerolineales bacterium]